MINSANTVRLRLRGARLRVLTFEMLHISNVIYSSSNLQTWARKKNIKLRYIQPSKPQQNSYVERYNRTLRYDWLNQYSFESIDEIRDFATKWLWSYNNERPNMGIGGIIPAMKLKQVA